MKTLSLFAILALLGVSAQAGKKEVTITNPDDMKWAEVAEGAKQTVLWGNPMKGAHGVITKFEGGTTHPLHYHTSELKIVMLSGSYWLEEENGKRMNVQPGGYMTVPAGNRHKSGCESDCSFFEEAKGKFDIVWLEGEGATGRKAKK